MGLIKEFREFAMRGNMMDMAVGIIIGGAFGGIVQSLIKDIIMPLVGMAGNKDFSNLYYPLKEGVRQAQQANPNLGLAEARVVGPVLAYGSFFTVLVNFIILAFVIFMMIKMVNTAKKRYEKKAVEDVVPPPATPEDVLLLREIRDALRAGR